MKMLMGGKMNKLKCFGLMVLLVGCQAFQYAGGEAKAIDNSSGGSGTPYFTLECKELNGCYRFAAEWCPAHRYHVVGKKTTNDMKWQVEFACESALDQ